jgi:exopolysaccharide production protein ExoZ
VAPTSERAGKHILDPSKIPAARQKNAVLSALQIARGLAALGVTFFHARLGTGAFVAAIPAPVERILAQGYLGVDFFFVLSGFIILHVHLDDPATADAARSYALKRLLRIYVPYLPITAILIGAYLLFPALSQANRSWGWLTTLTLLPSAQEPALPVAWTLVHEVMFYLLFLMFFVSRRAFAVLMTVWSCVLIKQAIAPESFGVPALSVLFSPINIEFVFGLLCALGFRIMDARHGVAAMMVGIAVLAIYFSLLSGYDNGRIVFGLGAALLVLGVALNDRELAGVAASAMVRIGDASYAIYLIHNPWISLTSRAAARVALLDSWFISLALSVISSVLVGYAYHRWFERPALARARKIAALHSAAQNARNEA